jgi:hypothetical protein
VVRGGISRLRKEQAIRILRTVDEGIAFHFCNGSKATNLVELFVEIAHLSEQEYTHHVYFDHNDFSNWLMDVIDDHKLALDIFSVSKRAAVVLIKARILYLKDRASI